jgi:Flp pilus assembly protein TadB
MSKITKHTDLTQSEGDPTSRADTDLPAEDFEIRVSTTRWPAAGIEIKTRTAPQSPLGNAVAAVLLILAGGLCVVLLHWIGVPWWAQLGGLLLPWVFCLTLRPARRRRARA